MRFVTPLLSAAVLLPMRSVPLPCTVKAGSALVIVPFVPLTTKEAPRPTVTEVDPVRFPPVPTLSRTPEVPPPMRLFLVTPVTVVLPL